MSNSFVDAVPNHLRIVSTLLLGLAIAGCQQGPSDGAATGAGPGSSAAEAAAPAAAVTRQPVQLQFTTDDAAIGSEVGVRTLGLGMATTGKAGWLIFGPYIPLEPGNYQVSLQGLTQAGHGGQVHVDVASDKGAKVIAAAELDAPTLAAAPPEGLIVLPFTVDHPVTDLEVRVRVTEASKMSISAYQIRSVP
jgi:hypothetical protein